MTFLASLPTITWPEIIRLRESGHVAHVMPRKRMVRVDGHRLYRLAVDPCRVCADKRGYPVCGCTVVAQACRGF